MANTWQAITPNVTATFAANKYMMDIFNAAASTRFIRVYRAYAFNNQIAAIAGVLNVFRVNITSISSTGGSLITPVAMDTSNSALNGNTTVGTARTIGSGTIIRNLLQSPDEAVVSTLDWDALATLVPFAEVWNAGYGDANIQPVTLRAGEARGFGLQSVTQTVGTNDYEIMFTDSAT
jgi:hypothetical protein